MEIGHCKIDGYGWKEERRSEMKDGEEL